MSTIARLSLAQYDRMIACGIFDSRQRQRLEFIRGEIREMNPIGPTHEEVVDRLTEWSIQTVIGRKVRVRVQNSIGLPECESAPEPDLVWVRKRDYSRGRPAAKDVLLVIEVAESSLEYDCGEKADLYAAAGIRDYWVVNLPERVIQLRRDPGEGGYRTVERYSGDDEVRPPAMPDVVLRPSMLWS